MEVELGFRLIFLNVCVLIYSIRRYYGAKIQSLTEKISRSERWTESAKYEGKTSVVSRTILSPIWVVALILFFVSPPWMAWSALPFPMWLRWAGIGLAMVCLPFLAWVQNTLGNHWSVHLKLRADHKLVTDGLYKWIRHPMYVVLFLFIVSVGLVSASLLIAILNMLLIIVFYNRVNKEEEMMTQRFGDEYRAYKQRTGRFLPIINYRRTKARHHTARI